MLLFSVKRFRLFFRLEIFRVEIGLTYDEYITSVVSKCIASLCQINRVKHILDKQSLITVIDGLVSSRLYYRSSVWSNTSKKNIVKLQNVQNFASRIITNTNKYDHKTPAIKQLNWLPCVLHVTAKSCFNDI